MKENSALRLATHKMALDYCRSQGVQFPSHVEEFLKTDNPNIQGPALFYARKAAKHARITYGRGHKKVREFEMLVWAMNAASPDGGMNGVAFNETAKVLAELTNRPLDEVLDQGHQIKDQLLASN